MCKSIWLLSTVYKNFALRIKNKQIKPQPPIVIFGHTKTGWFSHFLTLENAEEGVGKLAGEQAVGQFSEVLLEKVSHIVGLLLLIGQGTGRRLVQRAELLDA